MTTPELYTSGGLQGLLRNKIFPDVIRAIYENHPILQKVKRANQSNMQGAKLEVAIHVDNPGPPTFYTEISKAVAIPAATRSIYKKIYIDHILAMSTIQMDKIVIDRMGSSDTSWVRPLAEEMENLKTTHGGKIAALLHGDSTAKLATVTGFTNGDPDELAVDSTVNLGTTGLYDIITAAGEERATDVQFTAMKSGTVMTLVTSATPVAGDFIVPANSYNKGPHGLGTVMDNTLTDYFDIDRTADYRLQVAAIRNNGGSGNAALNPKKLMELIDTIKSRSGGKPDEIIMHSSVKAAVDWLRLPDNRYDPNQVAKLFGSGASVGVPLTADDDCPRNVMRAIKWKDLVLGQLGEFIAPYKDPEGQGFWMPVLSNGVYQTAHQASFETKIVLAALAFNGLGYLDEVTGLYDANSGYGNMGGVSS